MNYSEKLKDPRWQKKRLHAMEYAGWRCQICGVKDRTLHCHHSYYTKGKQPWQYPDGSIICICEGCHEKIHGKKKESKSELALNRVVPPLEAQERFAALKEMLMERPK